MRKKPDILLLLAVLVVSGVIFSNYVIFKQDNKTERLALLNAPFPQFQAQFQAQSQANNSETKPFRLHDLARIDLSKQQIH